MIVPLAFTKLYNDKKKEKYEDENENDEVNSSVLVLFLFIYFFVIVVSLVISFYAAYLSYECNTEKNFTSVVWAIFAFSFGIIYLVYYFFFNYLTGNCNIS